MARIDDRQAGRPAAWGEFGVMPQRAKRICAAPGCGKLTDVRYCDVHLRSRPDRQADRGRGSAASRGYGWRWQKLRKLVLARDPLCMIQVLCGRGVNACLRSLPKQITLCRSPAAAMTRWTTCKARAISAIATRPRPKVEVLRRPRGDRGCFSAKSFRAGTAAQPRTHTREMKQAVWKSL